MNAKKYITLNTQLINKLLMIGECNIAGQVASRDVGPNSFYVGKKNIDGFTSDTSHKYRYMNNEEKINSS